MNKTEKFLNRFLWIIWGGLSIYLIVLFVKYKAPEYEYYKDIGIEYVYTDKDGNKANSNYYLAWYHPQAKFLFIDLFPEKSVMCFYDPIYKNAASIKDEYFQKYQEIIPESHVSKWRLWITTISVFGIILLAFAVYFIGGLVRDLILFIKAKNQNNFQAYAYFLFKKRFCCVKKVRKGLLSTINPYIKKVENNEKRYSQLFTNLLVQILYLVKESESTKIPFYYYHTNDTLQQKEYLKNESKLWREDINYYETQLNIDPENTKISNLLNEARENLKYVDSIRDKNYIRINIEEKDADSSAWDVADVLDKLFTESYGDKIVRFEPYKYNFYDSRFIKKEGTIIVNSRIHNTTSWFNFQSRSDIIPGLRITITISCYQEGKEHVLWQKDLPPKCTYSYPEDESPDYDKLYANMIQETIKSFPDEIKKM